MKKGKAPAYQRYPGDIISNPDIAGLSLEEFGLFERMKDYIWLKGFLKMDEIALSKLVRVSPKTFRKLFESIKCLFEINDELITSPELEREREKHREHAAKSRIGGLHSGATRRERALKGTSNLVEPESKPSFSSSTSSSFPSSTSSLSSSSIEGHTPVPLSAKPVSRRGGSAGDSTYSGDERTDYADANKLGGGWLVRSKSGEYDDAIGLWIKRGRPRPLSNAEISERFR